MAIFKGGAGGVLSGMVGKIVIATSQSGKVYLRGAPRKHKFSDQQKQNWNRFSAVSSFWKKFEGSPIQQIWKVAQEGRRGINLFIKANAPAFNQLGELVYPEKLHFAAGKLALPNKLSGVTEEGKGFRISWEPGGVNKPAQGEDELMIVVARNGNFAGPKGTGIKRKSGSYLLNVEDGDNGVYLFFESKEKNMYSSDVYFPIG